MSLHSDADSDQRNGEAPLRGLPGFSAWTKLISDSRLAHNHNGSGPSSALSVI
jgi:hypothetical protein